MGDTTVSTQPAFKPHPPPDSPGVRQAILSRTQSQKDRGVVQRQPTLVSKVIPEGAGDLEIRAYRRQTKDPRMVHERLMFETKLGELSECTPSMNNLMNYKAVRTLGTGSFGRVVLLKHKTSGDYCACKVLSKERLVRLRQVEHTMNEKNILFATNSPFIVKLIDHFQDAQSLYLALEYVNGGELFSVIQRQRTRHLSEEQTRFFGAEAVLAFEYLHNLDIIFRDLKPENILVDARGHLKLTDFGFAKRVHHKTWTMCGTPEYLAPEIIINKGYAHAVDWWAVGVLIYEMRAGSTPFESKTQMELFQKIVAGSFDFPRRFSSDEKSLVSAFLHVDPVSRLGNMYGGAAEIKSHPYFACIHWDQLLAQTLPSPCVPKVKGQGDTSNFDVYKEDPLEWDDFYTDEYGALFAYF